MFKKVLALAAVIAAVASPLHAQPMIGYGSEHAIQVDPHSIHAVHPGQGKFGATIKFHYNMGGDAAKIGLNQSQAWLFDCNGTTGFNVDDNQAYEIPEDSPVEMAAKFACYVAASQEVAQGKR